MHTALQVMLGPLEPSAHSSWRASRYSLLRLIPQHTYTALQLMLTKVAQSPHCNCPISPGCIPTHWHNNGALAEQCSA